MISFQHIEKKFTFGRSVHGNHFHTDSCARVFGSVPSIFGSKSVFPLHEIMFSFKFNICHSGVAIFGWGWGCCNGFGGSWSRSRGPGSCRSCWGWLSCYIYNWFTKYGGKRKRCIQLIWNISVCFFSKTVK